MALESISLPYGEESLLAFKDSKTGNILLPENVKQIGFLHLSDIRPGQTGQFSLQSNQIDYPVLLASVLAYSSYSGREKVRFEISVVDSNDVEFLFKVGGNNNKLLSYDFPKNTIIYPTDNIYVKSQFPLDKVTFSMQRIVTSFDIKEPITIEVSPIDQDLS